MLPAMKDHELHRSLSLDRLAPRPGESILDVGCGAAEDLQRILRAHPGIRVTGIDRSEGMIRSGRRRLSPFIKRGAAVLVVGDVGTKLPFPSKSFDAVFSADLMECLLPAMQSRLLMEIHRVLKPRGRVLVEHTDWDTQVWNASDRELERKLVHAFCDWTQGWMDTSDGWMGRKLLGLFRQTTRFKGVEVSAHVRVESRYRRGTYGHARAQDLLAMARKGGVRTADVRRFLRDLASHDRAGTYFYSINRYLIAATAR
jgi:ubiquinone/menaquinone biosynthesis C-methylase UbiE